MGAAVRRTPGDLEQPRFGAADVKPRAALRGLSGELNGSSVWISADTAGLFDMRGRISPSARRSSECCMRDWPCRFGRGRAQYARPHDEAHRVLLLREDVFDYVADFRFLRV